MRCRVLVLLAALVASAFTGRTVVNANHGTTVGTSFCKWDVPRPRAVTSWDPDRRFRFDCRAAGASWRASNGYYDIHNVAAHEFGHWFHLGHSGDNNHSTNFDATMYCCQPLGEWKKRDLTSDDAAAALEYGYR